MPAERSASTPERPGGFARLAVVISAATLALIALGGTVRATDNGLACPTWPGCFSGGDFVPAFSLGVWLEHSHRLLAGVVGLLLLVQFVWAVRRFSGERVVLWTAGVAFAGVVVQGLLGALVVLRLLDTATVTAHLGLAMLVLACELFLAVLVTPRAASAPVVDRGVARTSVAVAALVYAQILVGGQLSGLGTGLAYVGEPFYGLAAVTPVASEGEAVNVLHRVLAVAVLAGVGVLAYRVRAAGIGGWQGRLARMAVGLVGLQILIGIANIASGLSALAVIPHLTVASWIWAVLVVQSTLAFRRAPRPALARAPRRVGARRLAVEERAT